MDGSHLKWSDFRAVVLSSFHIILADSVDLSDLPAPICGRVEKFSKNLDRFNPQKMEWRSQVVEGRGFGSTVVFPPNILPPIEVHPHLHRCLTPKLSREALPPRAVKAPKGLFELPAPRPGLITGFTTAAFNEAELCLLPSGTAATGTVVDFSTGCVSPGTTVYCPFLVFERMTNLAEETVQSAKNQCAIAGANCIRALQQLYRRVFRSRSHSETLICFSCAIENSTSLINYHFIDPEGRYGMSEVRTFDLDSDQDFVEFQAWVEAIEEWGSACLLPVVKEALNKLFTVQGTPPLSPMPSLTLSIDTATGGEDVLMKTLRSTFGTIKWRCEGEEETPLNSSVAHCGTPLPARKIRTMTLSPASPLDITGPGSNTPFSGWRMRPEWGHMSPHARRYPLSPLMLRSDAPDSPCRRATLSPCTPPPEAPYSAKSPMLVLQRRMDLAMDEIQELRKLVQSLHSELKSQNAQLEEGKSGQVGREISSTHQLSHPTAEDKLKTPVASKICFVETGNGKMEVGQFLRTLFRPASHSLTAFWTGMVTFIFLTFSAALGHGILETLICLLTVVGTDLLADMGPLAPGCKGLVRIGSLVSSIVLYCGI